MSPFEEMARPAIPLLFLRLCSSEMPMRAMYVATLFVGAALQFLVQPMVGKMVLPDSLRCRRQSQLSYPGAARSNATPCPAVAREESPPEH